MCIDNIIETLSRFKLHCLDLNINTKNSNNVAVNKTWVGNLSVWWSTYNVAVNKTWIGKRLVVYVQCRCK